MDSKEVATTHSRFILSSLHFLLRDAGNENKGLTKNTHVPYLWAATTALGMFETGYKVSPGNVGWPWMSSQRVQAGLEYPNYLHRLTLTLNALTKCTGWPWMPSLCTQADLEYPHCAHRLALNTLTVYSVCLDCSMHLGWSQLVPDPPVVPPKIIGEPPLPSLINYIF